MALNDAVDRLVDNMLSRKLADPDEVQARKTVLETTVESHREDLKRQRVETISLVGEKLSDTSLPNSVKTAFENLLDQWSK